MTFDAKHSQDPLPWFGIGIFGLFLMSLVFRFWGLSRFNTLVFDEVYYAKFASHFLKHELLFGGHPPLSTYIIAIGIWLGERLPFGDETLKNGLSGLYVATWSYRWLNALVGALIPLVVAAIAYQLSHRRSFAFIAGLFTAADGLLLVESRYALNNVYLIVFGLLGQLLLLIALRHGQRRWLYLALAGICFGASVAVKWNGLWFLLGAYLLWGAAWGVRIAWAVRLKWMKPPKSNGDNGRSKSGSPAMSGLDSHTPLRNLTQLNVGHVLLHLALIPFLTYWLSWIPYMQLDPNTSFWQWQANILDYHDRVGGMEAHPYCSPWYTWMWMIRPVAYFYKTAHSTTAAPSVVGPPLPQSTEAIVFDVHAMGNPLLWWFSTAALLLLISLLAQWGWQWLRTPRSDGQAFAFSTFPSLGTYAWISLYIVLNWVANLLPWVEVTRCTFLYHYMGASIFSFMAIAFLVDRWLHMPDRWHRGAGVTVIFLILFAFVFWLPMYLGLPMSPQDLQLRLLFRSWI